MLAAFSRIDLGRLLRNPFFRKIAFWLFINIHNGTDICGVTVRACGKISNDANEIVLSVIGQNESMMTTIIAAETTRQMCVFHLAPGVFHSEQVIILYPIIEELKNEFPNLVVRL